MNSLKHMMNVKKIRGVDCSLVGVRTLAAQTKALGSICSDC